MAKNQFLSLNVTKLSGQCGKLKCCLRFENDDYLALRKKYPPIGSTVVYKNELYRLESMNIIAQKCRLVNNDNAIFVDLNEIKAPKKDAKAS